jgi:hypothetical protein
MVKPSNVLSQWSQLIENFQASSQDFYAAFERAAETRAIPQCIANRVEHKEGGLASANREYLRLHRGKYAFDLCAAPFGTGFFVSWWFTVPPLAWGFLYTLAFFFGVMICYAVAYSIGFAMGLAISGITFGAFLSFASALLGVPAFLWFIGNSLRNGNIAGESTVLAIPLVGWLYERIFAPPSFYSIDTALMFQEAVHNAVLEVVDGMTASKGIRALTESQRKPIMKRFAASA